MRIVREETAAGSVVLHDFEPTPDRICEDVAEGLASTPKRLPPKYFYDDQGARLFERITGLDAYYPTRTEISILRDRATEIADHIGPGARLVEFGSGSGEKTWILLRHLKDPAAYIPVDISRAQLIDFALQVAAEFPSLRVAPVCADYTGSFDVPAASGVDGTCVAFFPGSTIGNFEPAEAVDFLGRVRHLVGARGRMLLGVDLRKNPEIIERAYNDPEGVTASFNLNVLARVNRECDGDFDLDRFRHHATFDPTESRIEMRLVSTVDQRVTLRCSPPRPDRITVDFAAGEAITTEYSYKYDLPGFARLAERAGWSIEESWTDPNDWFAVVLLR